MKSKIAFGIILIATLSCTEKSKESSTLPVLGTWQLISETKITNTDTVFAEASKEQPMIKILNANPLQLYEA